MPELSGTVSGQEILLISCFSCPVLSSDTASGQKKYENYIYAMMKSLKAAGAEDVVVRSYNALAVNVDLIDCDYYRFQELDPGAVNAYETEYMSQYSWADFLYHSF